MTPKHLHLVMAGAMAVGAYLTPSDGLRPLALFILAANVICAAHERAGELW